MTTLVLSLIKLNCRSPSTAATTTTWPLKVALNTFTVQPLALSKPTTLMAANNWQIKTKTFVSGTFVVYNFQSFQSTVTNKNEKLSRVGFRTHKLLIFSLLSFPLKLGFGQIF